MTFNQFLGVMGIVIPVAGAFIIAYLHRKQMRQVEAHRRDPAVGLIPPPHPLTLFYRKHSALLTIGPLSILWIVLQFFREGPVTRYSVLAIAVSVGAIVFAVFIDLLNRGMTVLGRLIDAIDATTRTVEVLTGGVEAFGKRLKGLEDSSRPNDQHD